VKKPPSPCPGNICGLILWREQENKREDGTPRAGLISTIMQIMQIKQKDPQFTPKRGGGRMWGTTRSNQRKSLKLGLDSNKKNIFPYSITSINKS